MRFGWRGAVGVVINRPTTTHLGDPLPTWEPLAAEPAVVFVGGSVRAQTMAGAFVVTFIAFWTLGGTGATTYTFPVSVSPVVRSRTTVPFFRSIKRPA